MEIVVGSMNLDEQIEKNVGSDSSFLGEEFMCKIPPKFMYKVHSPGEIKKPKVQVTQLLRFSLDFRVQRMIHSATCPMTKKLFSFNVKIMMMHSI